MNKQNAKNNLTKKIFSDFSVNAISMLESFSFFNRLVKILFYTILSIFVSFTFYTSTIVPQRFQLIESESKIEQKYKLELNTSNMVCPSNLTEEDSILCASDAKKRIEVNENTRILMNFFTLCIVVFILLAIPLTYNILTRKLLVARWLAFLLSLPSFLIPYTLVMFLIKNI